MVRERAHQLMQLDLQICMAHLGEVIELLQLLDHPVIPHATPHQHPTSSNQHPTRSTNQLVCVWSASRPLPAHEFYLAFADVLPPEPVAPMLALLLNIIEFALANPLGYHKHRLVKCPHVLGHVGPT